MFGWIFMSKILDNLLVEDNNEPVALWETDNRAINLYKIIGEHNPLKVNGG